MSHGKKLSSLYNDYNFYLYVAMVTITRTECADWHICYQFNIREFLLSVQLSLKTMILTPMWYGNHFSTVSIFSSVLALTKNVVFDLLMMLVIQSFLCVVFPHVSFSPVSCFAP